MQTGKMYLICFLCNALPFFAISQQCDSIPWSPDHSLQWNDFKGLPDNRINSIALSEPNIYYQFTTVNKLANLRVTCVFSTCHSWVKGKASINLLQHEQTHFDLAEYHKRLLVKEILNQQFSKENALFRVKAIGDLVNRNRREADELYDLETAHSINEKKQQEWTKRIRKMIMNLDEYDKSGYIITLN